MIFGRKKTRQNIDPSLALAELRSALELAVDEARACGARSYQIEQALLDAAKTVAIKRAACTPL